MILILSLCIPVVVLLIARVCYCWGVRTGYLESTQDHRMENIRKLEERLRKFSPKE